MKEKVLKVLSSDSKGVIAELLERIVEWEKKNPPRSEYHGFYWYEVQGDPRILNSLVLNGVLKVVLKTNSGTAYRLVDLKATEEALSSFKNHIVEGEEEEEEEETKVPPDILDVVVGHEDKKEVIIRALNSPKRCHLLLYGSPASAKSLILECLSSLPRAKMILGSSSTKAGLFDLLYTEEPRFLIIDEIDKIEDTKDLSILLSLMESGRISETKFGRRRVKVLNTKVIAAANKIDKIPPELLSRFIKLKFKEYTDEEFLKVSEKVLETKEEIPRELASYIAEQVLKKMKSRDVRDCIKVARLLREQTKQEVDNVVSLLSRHY